ncbi:MAG: inositol monophosphatase family protein [Balneolaceae bacterium]
MSRDLNVALEAARKGVAEIETYRNKNLDVQFKGHNDLVTDADIATEKVIVDVLRSHFPEDEILAEESSNGRTGTAGRLWVVDPIDGTTNFTYGFPVFCVSIALLEDGKSRVAVVIEVNRNEEFTAVRDEGAWLNGRKIAVSDIEEPARALIGTGFPYNDYSLFAEYMELLHGLLVEIQGIRRPGAATFDLCCVAAGRFQGFYEYSLKAWDVAAASLIIQEAGGVVTDSKGGQDWLLGERIIAGNRTIHSYLLEKIQAGISQENQVPA